MKHLNKSNAVVSLGGGAFINDIVREEITKNSIAFWLYWNEKTLIRIRWATKGDISYFFTKTEVIGFIEVIKKIPNKTATTLGTKII